MGQGPGTCAHYQNVFILKSKKSGGKLRARPAFTGPLVFSNLFLDENFC